MKIKNMMGDNVNLLSEELLKIWCDKLLSLQITDQTSKGLYGGILCEGCGYIHGRCADIIYPMVALYAKTGEQRYLSSAQMVYQWQKQNVRKHSGINVNDTFNTWHGVTEFYLMGLGLTLLEYAKVLPETLYQEWYQDLLRVGETIYQDPLFLLTPESTVSINYPVGYLAAMAVLYAITGEKKYQREAMEQEDKIYWRITNDGWLFGENASRPFVTEQGCSHIDLGYNVEESIGLLALYGKLVDSRRMTDLAAAMLRKSAECMLPDGAWDNTWGSRAVKWTYYGSRTTDGVQMACSLLQEYDPLFAEIALRNTQLMYDMTVNGLLTGGKMYDTMEVESCAHHALSHAKSLAFLLKNPIRKTERKTLPRDEAYGTREIQSAGVTLASVGEWRGTFQTNDLAIHGSQEVSGVTLLYHKKAGALLVSNGFRFSLLEPTNMQIPFDLAEICQTLRIDSGKLSSLFCKKAVASVQSEKDRIAYGVTGYLSDPQKTYGADYHMDYVLEGSTFTVTACCAEQATLWLPLVCPPDTAITCSEKSCTYLLQGAEVAVVATQTLSWKDGYYRERVFNTVGGFATLPLQIKLQKNIPVTVTITVV